MKPSLGIKGFSIQSRVAITNEKFSALGDDLAVLPGGKRPIIKVHNPHFVIEDESVGFRGFFHRATGPDP